MSLLPAMLGDLEMLSTLRRQAERDGVRVVFTNGVFDILHRGHVTYLAQALAFGDVLVVGVNADESVRALKGDARPVNPLGDRLAVLSALKVVDYVVPFADSTPAAVISALCPDIYVKGGDYRLETLPERPLCDALNIQIRFVPYDARYSTTRLIERIARIGWSA